MDAINDDLVKTRIYLDRNFRNKRSAKVWKVSAPNGYTDHFRQTVTENSQHMLMWKNCKCKIEELVEDREVRGCNINGIQLSQPELNILEYESEGKATATAIYNDKIKPELEKMGYTIEKHVCVPYQQKKKIDGCHNGTLKDPKWEVNE